ncbi:MAG TPA: class I SAM-dependent methyltransferase [Candidatus Limnocylindrales bacterium]
MRPKGEITRGTTNPNRLRRIDRWIAWRCRDLLTATAQPLVVDLGFGASPITAVELRQRLSALNPGVRVVGLEIDRERVAAAQPMADPPRLTFAHGGFELAGLRPDLVRALNVLRQYDESEVARAWARMSAAMRPPGLLVEGTCDELGRVCAWVAIEAGSSTPVSLTFAAKLSALDTPLTFAERLPKSLIHHNVAGASVHDVLSALESAWLRAAPTGVFGPRQRWIETVRTSGLNTLDGPSRWRLGEVTLPYPCIDGLQ